MEHQASGTHSTRQPCEAATFVDFYDPTPKPCSHGDWRILWLALDDLQPYTFTGRYSCAHHETRHIQNLKRKTLEFWGNRPRPAKQAPDATADTLF